MTPRKVALVTGGSRGLGKEMALRIAEYNIDVVITYHQNEAAALEVVREIEKRGVTGHCLQLDSRDTHSFDSFYTKFGDWLVETRGSKKFDFLVNNAGTGIQSAIADTTEEQFDEMLHIHLKGVFFFTQKALPHLNDEGSIINISSGLARFAFPGYAAYAIMKGAIEVFTRYLAKELGPRGITANVVAPGAVATDFGGGSNRDNEQKRNLISSVTALGRVGEAEDIGGIVAFLCSEDAHWMTAQRLEASGGTLI
ncbi:SDR family oxidoreductase [bacterium SCSIO 12741]|nr:SDR family oxidoreductase [bacterium SCSIO 12741]